MAFAAKIFLWGLLGLLIPLIIHLWNKQKPKVISIGSLELMEPFEADHARRLRFSDWWRLLLRCLIVGTLVILLMQPYLLKQETMSAPVFYDHIVLIDPNLEEETFLLESVTDLNKPAFLLQEGWPPVYSSGLDSLGLDSLGLKGVEQVHFTDYFALLTKLDFADTVTLFGKNQAVNFTGTQPSLPFVLHWKLLPSEESDLEEMDNQLSAITDSLKIGFQNTNNTKNSNKVAWNIIKVALESIAEQSKMTLVFDSLNPDCFFCFDDGSDKNKLESLTNCNSGFKSGNENLKFVLVEQNKQLSHPQLFRQSNSSQYKLVGDFRRTNTNISSLPLVLSDFFLQENILPVSENHKSSPIAEEQLILPQSKKKQQIVQAKVVEEKDRQHFPFWLLLVTFVLLERLLSVRSKSM